MYGRQRKGHAQYSQDSSDDDSSSSGSDEDAQRSRRVTRRLNDVVAVHRPYYPSPLSQSPLQASLSSLSRTAASVASSAPSVASTPTTSRSTGSRFSIAQEFDSLNDDDIDFFDTLIARLSPHASDFSQLKQAYNHLLAEQIQERGQQSGVRDRDSDWDAHLWSSLLSLVKVRGQDWRERWDSVRIALGLDPISSSGESDDHDTQSQTVTDTDDMHDESEIHSSTSTEHNHPYVNGRSHSILPPRDSLGLPAVRIERPVRQDHRFETQMPSPSGSVRADFARLRVDVPSRDPPPATASGSKLLGPAKTLFDDYVRSSRLERENLRQTQTAAHASEQEQYLSEQYDLADQKFAGQLLRTCLAWWIACTRRELRRARHADRANHQLLLARAWDTWRRAKLRRTKALKLSQRTNDVRCKLTSFRCWKRRTQDVSKCKQDARQERMRAAYYQTSLRVKSTLVTHAFHTWRRKYFAQMTGATRRRTLQAAAFDKWHDRTVKARQLLGRTEAFSAAVERSMLHRAWMQWRERFEQSEAELEYSHHRSRRMLRTALHRWRHAMILSQLARAYTERRLKTLAMDRWSSALERNRASKKQLALADRWYVRTIKHATLRQWTARLSDIIQLTELADDFRAASDEDVLREHVRHWQLRGRHGLLVRVWQTRTLSAALQTWFHRHSSLVTALTQRESSFVHATQLAAQRSALRLWRDATRKWQDNIAMAVQASHQNLLAHSVDLWRHRYREREAAAMMQRHDARLTQQVFVIWRMRASQLAREREAVQHMQMRMAHRTSRTALRWWIERVIAIRGREYEVMEQRNRRMQWAALTAWIEAVLRIDELRNRMHAFRHQQDQQGQRRVLAKWTLRMHMHRSLRERESVFVLHRQPDLLVQRMWNQWRDKLAECALNRQEYMMLAIRHHLALQTAVRRWIRRATLLPLVQRANHAHKQAAFSQWQDALPRQQALHLAMRVYERRLLQQTWSKWTDEVRLNVQYRAATRYASVSSANNSRSNSFSSPKPIELRRRHRRRSTPIASTPPPTMPRRNGGEETRPPNAGHSTPSPFRSSSPYTTLYEQHRAAPVTHRTRSSNG